MSNDQSKLINPDGGIGGGIPRDKATWFSFLQASRVFNSKKGGWNSKTHWFERGLSVLTSTDAAADILSGWTSNSLQVNSDPRARTSDFRISARGDTEPERTRGKPGSENNLNWRLFCGIRKKFQQSTSGHKRLITYELPLADTSQGQLKADLVTFDQSGFVEIIELKKSGGRSDTPLMALVEAICYSLQLIRCWNSLSIELSREGICASDLTRLNIILAGPDYWHRWKGEGGKEFCVRDIGLLQGIVECVGAALRVHATTPRPRLTLTLADVVVDEAVELKALVSNTPPDGSIVAG